MISGLRFKEGFTVRTMWGVALQAFAFSCRLVVKFFALKFRVASVAESSARGHELKIGAVGVWMFWVDLLMASCATLGLRRIVSIFKGFDRGVAFSGNASRAFRVRLALFDESFFGFRVCSLLGKVLINDRLL